MNETRYGVLAMVTIVVLLGVLMFIILGTDW